MSRPAPAWHAEARALHKQGQSAKAIATSLGQNPKYVGFLLNEKAYARLLAQQSVSRDKKRADAAVKPAPKPAKPDTMAIARLFVAGKIDRAELSRRRRGEARP